MNKNTKTISISLVIGFFLLFTFLYLSGIIQFQIPSPTITSSIPLTELVENDGVYNSTIVKTQGTVTAIDYSTTHEGESEYWICFMLQDDEQPHHYIGVMCNPAFGNYPRPEIMLLYKVEVTGTFYANNDFLLTVLPDDWPAVCDDIIVIGIEILEESIIRK